MWKHTLSEGNGMPNKLNGIHLESRLPKAKIKFAAITVRRNQDKTM